MNIETLKQIHNVLSLISVKGEDVLRLADCMLALRDVIEKEE